MKKLATTIRACTRSAKIIWACTRSATIWKMGCVVCVCVECTVCTGNKYVISHHLFVFCDHGEMGRWLQSHLGSITIHWTTGNKKLAIKSAAFFRADVESAKLIISHRLAQKSDTISESNLTSATFMQ